MNETPKRAPSPPTLLKVSNPEDVRWWCAQLNCTPQQLLDAVRAEGEVVDRLRVYLQATKQ